MGKLTLLALLVGSAALVAAGPTNSTVIQVLADQVFALASMEKAGDWNPDDHVCIHREKEKVACGIIVQATAKAAKVKLNFQYKTVKVGDTVTADDSGDRSPSNVDPSAMTTTGTADGPYPRFNILVGVKQNLSTQIPFVHIQQISNNHLSLGIQADLASMRVGATTTVVQAMGATFNANYYSESPYKGFWFQAGTGFAIMAPSSTGLTQTAYAPTLVGLVGWRNKWALGLNIGISMGIQYYLLPAGMTADFEVSALQPVLSVDIGFNIF